jgi:mRNA interferase HigB
LTLQLLGRVLLEEFKKKHTIAKKPIDAWTDDVQSSIWKTSQCIKNRYRNADFLHGNKVIFDIKGNTYRLVAKVDYARQVVLVEWIGSHAEYVKKTF